MYCNAYETHVVVVVVVVVILYSSEILSTSTFMMITGSIIHIVVNELHKYYHDLNSHILCVRVKME